MNDVNKEVATREEQAPARQEAAEVVTLRPATDIVESKDGVTLYIDMPGVSKDSLSVDVDQNVLSVKGAINLHTPEGLSPTYMDVHSGTFERHFTLGEQLDSSAIEAHLEQGVLKLSIPRSEKHKPRKIEVKVA